MSTNEPPPMPPSPPPFRPPYGGGGYSVGNAFSYGWTKFIQNLAQVLVAAVVLVVVLVAVQAIGYVLGRGIVLQWLFGLASWIVTMIVSAGLVRGALDVTEGRQLDPRTLLTPHKLGDVVVASLLTGIATFVGFILLVIPGLLVMFFTSYTLYFLMDRQGLGAIDAIKASFEFTKTNAADVILWFLLSLAAWFVGALLCGVGLVVAVPVVLLGTAYTYKTLDNQPVAP
jgi:uncharacterized membrane protein